MKVTSKKTVSFPQFKWGINKGETRELPADEKAQAVILAHRSVSEVSGDEEKPEPTPTKTKSKKKAKSGK